MPQRRRVSLVRKMQARKADVDVRRDVTNPAGLQRWQAHVVGWEAVDVPAGRFRALKVERQMLSNLADPLVYKKVTAWYSPEAKAVVRMEWHGSYEGSMTIQRDTRELTNYSLH